MNVEQARAIARQVRERVRCEWGRMPVPRASTVFVDADCFDVQPFVQEFSGRRFDQVDLRKPNVYGDYPLYHMTERGATYYLGTYLDACLDEVGKLEMWDGPENHLVFALWDREVQAKLHGLSIAQVACVADYLELKTHYSQGFEGGKDRRLLHAAAAWKRRYRQAKAVRPGRAGEYEDEL